MAAPKRLVLFVEGDGDVAAAPALIGKLLNEMQASDALFLDSKPLRIGGVTSLFGKKEKNWTEKLLVAAKRGNLGGVLLLQDGDVEALRGATLLPPRHWPGLVPSRSRRWCRFGLLRGVRIRLPRVRVMADRRN